MTDLFENWNRYYFPDIGRYLSPDPALQTPTNVLGRAQMGSSMPTYAYARNNPMTYVDRDGFIDDDCTTGEVECTQQAKTAHDAWCECEKGGGQASIVHPWQPVGCRREVSVVDGDTVDIEVCDLKTTRIQGIRCDSDPKTKDEEQKCSGAKGQGKGSWTRSTPTDQVHFNSAGGANCNSVP